MCCWRSGKDCRSNRKALKGFAIVTLLQKLFTAENAERAEREKCKIRMDLVFSLPNPQEISAFSARSAVKIPFCSEVNSITAQCSRKLLTMAHVRERSPACHLPREPRGVRGQARASGAISG